MKTISILNLKGGVAKTFTAANMAYELYRRGYKVLLIDNDKQGNLSKAYSRYDAENVAPVTKLLAGDWESADELIQHTEYEGIDIVTANMSLFGATWNLTKEDSGNQIERYKALVYYTDNHRYAAYHITAAFRGRRTDYYGIGARYRTSITYIAANNRNGGYEHCNHADRKYTVADYSSITAAYGAGTGTGSSAARTD